MTRPMGLVMDGFFICAAMITWAIQAVKPASTVPTQPERTFAARAFKILGRSCDR